MQSLKPKTAEANFREAFERLKAARPNVLLPGTPVSQNNVSREAGCDPSALRKSRFPAIVEEIQAYVSTHGNERPTSARQRMLKARQVSRNKSEMIANLKAQRDEAASRLVEAQEKILELHTQVRKLETELQGIKPSANFLPITSVKPRAYPHAMDMPREK